MFFDFFSSSSQPQPQKQKKTSFSLSLSTNTASANYRAEFAAKDEELKGRVEAVRAAATASFEASLARARRKGKADSDDDGDGGPSSSSSSSVGAPPEFRRRLAEAFASLSEGLVERDTEVRLLLLAALAGEHLLFLGPPGTAKSELARRLSRLSDGPFFERLLTRFSVPEELFGPLSMRALEEDRYVRQTEGYLPTAAVAFVDEVFKASSAILTSLLTLLNERAFDNGSGREPAPLACLVGASNELPESEELDALFDRFLIRREVGQVSAEGLPELLRSSCSFDEQEPPKSPSPPSEGNGNGDNSPSSAPSPPPPPPPKVLSAADLALARAGSARVSVPDDVLDIVADLRSHLQSEREPPVYCSDRRLVKAVRLLRTAAWADGRGSVSRRDAMLLRHVLWQRPGESAAIGEWLVGALADDAADGGGGGGGGGANGGNGSLSGGVGAPSYLFGGLFGRACIASSSSSSSSSSSPSPASRGPLSDVAADLAALREVLETRLGSLEESAAAAAGGGVSSSPSSSSSSSSSLWLSPEESEALDAALSPRLERAAARARDLLFEVATLDAALEAGAEAVTLADLLPRRWAEFIRSGDVDDVRPLGTRRSSGLGGSGGGGASPSLPIAAP